MHMTGVYYLTGNHKYNEGANEKIDRISAFSYNDSGGNPAGVAICDAMPVAREMLEIAKGVGYSETAFLHKYTDGWRVRYFAPEMEVPFCGHATIAAGYVLGMRHGEGRYKFYLNNGYVDVLVENIDDTLFVSLNSPPTSSEPAPSQYVQKVLKAFGLLNDDVDSDFPIYFASAGARHLIIVLKKHENLSSMSYQFDVVRRLPGIYVI